MATGDRTTFIGGSDASVICGISPWKTPYQLWLEKTGKDPPPHIDNPAIHWGNILEPVLRQEFERLEGIKLTGIQEEVVHPEHDFIVGHIDGKFEIEGKAAGWEGKTTRRNFLEGDGKAWGDAGTDHVPIHYLIQCMHYLACTGFDRWALSVLIGGQDFRTYMIVRDEELINRIIEKEVLFWEQVKTDTPPEPVSERDIKAAYPPISDKKIYADIDIYKAQIALKDVKMEIKDLNKQRTDLEILIKQYMQDAEELAYKDTCLATWKEYSKECFDVDQFLKDHPELYKQYLKTQKVRTFLTR